jgi:hypothetical protein
MNKLVVGLAAIGLAGGAFAVGASIRAEPAPDRRAENCSHASDNVHYNDDTIVLDCGNPDAIDFWIHTYRNGVFTRRPRQILSTTSVVRRGETVGYLVTLGAEPQ